MGDIKLFQIAPDHVTELPPQSVAVEKSLQTLIERNLEALLGVRFLASEYSTGKTHGGRIDTLGIDENGYPVIIEYKRALNVNVMSQGLAYLNWLLDHRAEFKLLVLDKFGADAANKVEWSNPRVVLIAGDFTRFDKEAVQQMPQSIELIRYCRYGTEHLLLEQVNAPATVAVGPSGGNGGTPAKGRGKTVSEFLEGSPQGLRDLFGLLDTQLKSMGDDVQFKTLKDYFAYQRIKNFACVEVHPQTQTCLVYVKVNPDTVSLEPGFTRDVRKIGHFGTGDLEIRIKTTEDLERAHHLLQRSYEAS